VTRAVARPRLSRKGGDSDRASIRSDSQARLVVNVQPDERYTVEWSAKPENEDVYSIDIFTDVGLGSHQEAFSGSGSWSFWTRDYEGEVTIVVEFLYAFSKRRYLDVSVG